MMALEDWTDYLYLPEDPKKLAHIVPFGHGDIGGALCGAMPNHDGWYGTGCWAEMEIVLTCERCPKCLDKVTS